MSHRLNIRSFREAAAAHGDRTDYAIAKRTGLGTSTVSRLVNGACQPSASTLSRIVTTYQIPLGHLMTIEGEQVAA
jgi:transcriptional regulator with XRE-family HTH domain